MITAFSEDVCAKMKHYVYLLVDSRNNEIFYVGKGSGNRVFEHEVEEKYADKNIRINDIKDSGGEVLKFIVHAGMNGDEAFACEAALINFLRTMHDFSSAKLLNIQDPHNLILPCVKADAYEKRYAAKSLTKSDFDGLGNVVFANMMRYKKNMTDPDEIRSITLGRLQFSEKYILPDLAFAVHRGVILNAYNISGWSREEDVYSNDRVYRYNAAVNIEENSEIRERYYLCNVSEIMKPNAKGYKRMLYKYIK